MLRNTSEKDKINENKDTLPHAVAPDRRIRLCRGSDIGRYIWTYSPSGSIELPIIVLPLASGKCGSNLDRRLYDDGRLTITGTGAKITVKGKTHTVVIKGDIDGDGKISAADYIRVRKYIIRITKPDGSALLAAHTSTDVSKQVSTADYIAIRMHILTRTSLGTTGIWLS